MANVDIDAIIDWFELHPNSYAADKDIPTSLAVQQQCDLTTVDITQLQNQLRSDGVKI